MKTKTNLLFKISEAIKIADHLSSDEKDKFAQACHFLIKAKECLPIINETDKEDSVPEGKYGVFAEPRGHFNSPCWTNRTALSYEEAIEEADYMNRANKQWHYSAKPMLS